MSKTKLITLALLLSANSAIAAPQQRGVASWYEVSGQTAAHKSLPFGTKVKVTNLRNGKSTVVIINDRGPFVRGRVIDLSTTAARQIGFYSQGVAPVNITVVGQVHKSHK